MHILHLCEAWNGGISTYIRALVEQQTQQDGITKITLLYDPDKASKNFDIRFFESRDIRLVAYHSSRNPFKVRGVSRAVRRHIQDLKPDIVHMHSSFAGIYGRLKAIPKVKTVYCPHGWSFMQEDGAFKQFFYRAVEKRMLKRTDAIINISNHEQDAAAKAGMQAKQNIVILSGAFDTCPENVQKASFKINPEALNFGYIGRLDHKKGFDILAREFSNDNLKDMHLYVIGAEDRGSMKTLPISKNIHYLGWMGQDKIDAAIRNFDGVIIPSRHEAFGLVALEAMRNAKPCIVSNKGALPELVCEGKDGFVFDLDNASESLPKILTSVTKADLEKMGISAREKYEERYKPERFAADILELYKSL